MLLKDFGFNFPQEGRESHSQLDFETRCIMALYLRCFPGLKVEHAWKVLINCVPVVTRPNVIHDGCGIYMIERPFDMQKYLAADITERKRMALETLHRGVLDVAQSSGWPLEPFETAYKGVVERNYVNEWTWPKSPKSSPDRKHKAYVQCLHEHDGFYAWIVVEDKKGNRLVKEFAFRELPSEFCFVPKLGKLIWTSNERVVLLDRKENEIKTTTL